MEARGLKENRAPINPGQIRFFHERSAELQIPRLPPDFLSGFVVSVKLMRLSLEKAAYVAVD
jgi:hypothetical protein